MKYNSRYNPIEVENISVNGVLLRSGILKGKNHLLMKVDLIPRDCRGSHENRFIMLCRAEISAIVNFDFTKYVKTHIRISK